MLLVITLCAEGVFKHDDISVKRLYYTRIFKYWGKNSIRL